MAVTHTILHDCHVTARSNFSTFLAQITHEYDYIIREANCLCKVNTGCSNLNCLFFFFPPSLSLFFCIVCSEENVWKLCEQVRKTRPIELSKCYAVFVSNEGRTVPLWRQKAGRGDDKVVIWVSILWKWLQFSFNNYSEFHEFFVDVDFSWLFILLAPGGQCW